MQNPPNTLTSDLVPCFLDTVLHFVHGVDNSPDRNSYPGAENSSLPRLVCLPLMDRHVWAVSAGWSQDKALPSGCCHEGGSVSWTYESASPPLCPVSAHRGGVGPTTCSL